MGENTILVIELEFPGYVFFTKEKLQRKYRHKQLTLGKKNKDNYQIPSKNSRRINSPKPWV